MLGGEIGKIRFGRIKKQLGCVVKETRFVNHIAVQYAGADFKVIGIQFMTVFITLYVRACP